MKTEQEIFSIIDTLDKVEIQKLFDEIKADATLKQPQNYALRIRYYEYYRSKLSQS